VNGTSACSMRSCPGCYVDSDYPRTVASSAALLIAALRSQHSPSVLHFQYCCQSLMTSLISSQTAVLCCAVQASASP
jgi:hypothetical protein